MATRTLGTNLTTSLTAIQWAPSGAGLLAADIGVIMNGILDDSSPAHQQARILGTGGMDPGTGMITLPGARGTIYPKPGDFIAIDSVSGWPILVSANALNIGGTLWTHT
jgi:hypothetical protein